MPKLPPSPCKVHICKNYAHDRGYCEDHADRIKKNSWDHGGKNRHERGYGSAWDKIKKIVKRRDKHQCQNCLKNGVFKVGTEVDHIRPKSAGGSDHLSNLQLLCYDCHKAKTNSERQK